MKVSFAATNPCHLFPFAKEFHRSGHLGTYFSGYPRWKLKRLPGMPVTSFPLRTLITYGLLRLPVNLRPKDHRLFRWQDEHFDRKAAGALGDCDAIHGIPGQCRQTFQRARDLGITTVLNHATGPSACLTELLRPEFERVGMELETETAYGQAYLENEDMEYALADYHCAASSVVRQQLIDHLKIPPERIWTVPYAADERIFHPPVTRPRDKHFRIIFAGQTSLRKGVRHLLDAVATVDDPHVELHFYGFQSPETKTDFGQYRGRTRPKFFGAVSQQQLAEAFRAADVLALPSLEEGFGLVVPQALNCGLPCIVSDAVGASDLIQHRSNGSIFPSGDSAALAAELDYWKRNPAKLSGRLLWSDCAKKLASYHAALS